MEVNVHHAASNNARSGISDTCRKRVSTTHNNAFEDPSNKRFKADGPSRALTAAPAHNTSTRQCENPPPRCPLVMNPNPVSTTLRPGTQESIEHHLELHRLPYGSSLPARFELAPSLSSILSLAPRNHPLYCDKLPSLDASYRGVNSVDGHSPQGFDPGLDGSAIWVTRGKATLANEASFQTSAEHELLLVRRAAYAAAASPGSRLTNHVANGAKRAHQRHQPSRLLDLPPAVLERVLIFSGRAGGRAACSCHALASIWHVAAMQPEYAARYLLEVFGPKMAAAYLYDVPELLKLASGERIPMVQRHNAGGGGACPKRGRDDSRTKDEAAAAILRCLVRAGADVVGMVEDVIALAASQGHVRVVLLALQIEAGQSVAANDTGSTDGYNDGYKRLPTSSSSCLDHGSSSLALVMAAKAGQLSVVRAVMLALVSPPPAPDAITAALTSACEGGHVAVVMELLYGGRHHVAARGNDGFRSGCELSAIATALLAACRAGRSTCAALLLRLGPPNTQEALCAAAAAGQAGCVTLLLSPSLRTVVVSTVAAAGGCSGGDGGAGGACAVADGRSLLAAATAGHPTVVRQLLCAGADARAADAAKAMQAALHVDGSRTAAATSAVSRGQCAGTIDVETLQALLDHGAAPSDDALTAAAVAAAKGAGGGLAAVKALLAAGADAAGGDTAAALLAACTGPHGVAAVKALLAAGADANARRGLPLIRACVSGHHATALALLAAGAWPNCRCGLALVAAARRGNPSLVSALIAAGAGVHPNAAMTTEGSTVHARCGSTHAPVPQQTAVLFGFSAAHVGLPVQHQQQQMQYNLEMWRKDLQDLARECREQQKRRDDIPLVADSGPLVAACAAAAAAVAEASGVDSGDGRDSDEAGGNESVNPDYAAVIRILLDAGCDANEASGLPLRLAAASGRIDVVRALLTGGADRAACGGQALVVASRRGYVNIVRELLASPAPAQPLLATVARAWGAATLTSQLLHPPSMAPAAAALAAGYQTMTTDAPTQRPLESRSDPSIEGDGGSGDGGGGGGDGARAGGCLPGASRALELAARNGHEDVVKELLAAGVPHMATGRAAVQWWRGDMSANRDVGGTTLFG